MRNLLSVILLLFFATLLSSCSTGEPSVGDIQTAIAETSVASPVETTLSPNAPIVLPTITSKPSSTATLLATQTPEVSSIPNMGSRSNPVPFGVEYELSEDGTMNYSMAVVEVLKGNDAWEKILAANSFNNPASDPYEYILIKVAIEYSSGPDDKILELNDYDFGILSSNNIIDSSVLFFVVSPTPSLDVKLFPGGANEGYLVKVFFKGDPNPLLYIGDPSRQAYYFSLQPR